MRLHDLVAALERIAPPALAEPWDNAGLIAGDPAAPLHSTNILLTIDLTDAVVDEALRRACGAVVTYHPPIFTPLKRLRAGPSAPPAERILHALIAAGVAVYSPHTALDSAERGLTDWLADGLLMADAAHPAAGGDRRPLRPAAALASTQEVKIVTLVPAERAESVRSALSSSGAGIIGAYDQCSFAAPGQGTFRGDDSTNPAVGRKGVLETVPELRLEMVCSRTALPLALTALRRFHPYEQPAIDVYDLRPQPSRAAGAGRRVVLDHPLAIDEIGRRLKARLNLSELLLARASRAGQSARQTSTIAIVPGSGGELLPDAIAHGCDLFITGEMKHHDILAALSAGVSVLIAGHTQTERAYLPELAARLHAEHSALAPLVSAADRAPLEHV